MKLLVIGAGMMGTAAAYDMARSSEVESVTVVDAEARRAKACVQRITAMLGADSKKAAGKGKIRALRLDADNERAAQQLMSKHEAALSALSQFFNFGFRRPAIRPLCTFAEHR